MLRTAGVDVVDYPVRKEMIDHVKLLVVDAAVAVVGGINWGVNSPANHDYDAEVRGPVVRNLDRVFDRDLVTCGRATSVPDPRARCGDRRRRHAARRGDPSTRAGAHRRRAQHTLDLELFVLTDTGVVHALEAAALRGVAVRVLLDPSQPSSDPSYAALLADGIQVRWYRSRGELLHAKAIVADFDLGALRERQLVRRRFRAQPRARHRADRRASRRRRDARSDESRLGGQCLRPT